MDGQIINDWGLDIIKHFEGWRSKPYRCSAGVPTIGWGSTYGLDGRKITMRHPPIDKNRGEALLLNGLRDVYRSINRRVIVELTDNQFSALCSFIYNLGDVRFASSTLLRKINNEDFYGAALEFPKWRMAAGRVERGLVRRRAEEQRLFCS